MDIQQQKRFKVLLIGDNCVDVYNYGKVERLSSEAPVPIFVPIEIKCLPGMADNVRLNLQNMNCDVKFIHRAISEKERLIDKRSKQQLLRVDRDVISDSISIDSLRSSINYLYDFHVVVISDYNKGTVSADLIKQIRKEFTGPIFIDTKKQDLSQFQGCFIKINELEYINATSLPDEKYLIVTLGENGARYREKKFDIDSVEVSDVTGAGDTFLSALAYKYLDSNNIETAIKFALKASSITVQHFGCYAPTLEEIE